MPQIIVTTGAARDPREGEIVLRERVNASDFESERFAANLVERLGWAVGDANALEQQDRSWEPAPEVEELESLDRDRDPDPLGVA
jgi:hypothetical protein